MTSFAEKKSRIALIGLALGFMVMGCEALAPTDSSPSALAPSPPSSPVPFASPVPTVTPQSTSKPVTFSVEVTDPFAELKIKPGMFVQKGQIIADPQQERLRLTSNQQTLTAQLEALDQKRLLNVDTRPEEQAIAIAKEQISLANAELVRHQQNSPWTDFARNNLPIAEDELKVNQLRANIDQAEKNLQVAQSRLQQKQQALQNFHQEQQAQQTQIQQALQQIEQKLLTLKPSRSPQSGTITKIDFPKQGNNPPLKVSVTLAPGLIPNDNAALETLPTLPNPAGPGQPLGRARDLSPPPNQQPLASPSPVLPPLVLPSGE